MHSGPVTIKERLSHQRRLPDERRRDLCGYAARRWPDAPPLWIGDGYNVTREDDLGAAQAAVGQRHKASAISFSESFPTALPVVQLSPAGRSSGG